MANVSIISLYSRGTSNILFIGSSLFLDKADFTIYKRKNEQSDNNVTKSASTIDKFLQKNYPLNGQWYHYSFKSKQDNCTYQETIYDINNYTFTATYPQGKRKGSLIQTKEYTLLLLEHSVIRLHNIHLNDFHSTLAYFDADDETIT